MESKGEMSWRAAPKTQPGLPRASVVMPMRSKARGTTPLSGRNAQVPDRGAVRSRPVDEGASTPMRDACQKPVDGLMPPVAVPQFSRTVG